VLSLCAKQGLASVGVIAVDGTKLPSNASRNANVDYEQIAREILEEARAVDAAEDELYGSARGDELPEQLRTGEGRRAWLREAKRRLEEQRAKEARPVPRSRGKRLKEAKRRLDEELWSELRANRAYERYRTGRMKDGRRFGRPPDPYTPPATPQGQINLTDPDSHVVKGSRGRGFLQGYNAQAVANEHQIVIAAEVMTVAPDFGHLEPMLDAAQRELAAAGVTDVPAVLLGDAGYWHQQQMEHIVDRGITVLIPPDAKSRKGTRPGWDGGLYAFMRRVLATERGGELYGQPSDHRAGVRQYQVQPRHRPLQTTRTHRRPHRVATDHGDAQPPQAPATRHSGRLRRRRRPQPPRRPKRTLRRSAVLGAGALHKTYATASGGGRRVNRENQVVRATVGRELRFRAAFVGLVPSLAVICAVRPVLSHD